MVSKRVRNLKIKINALLLLCILGRQKTFEERKATLNKVAEDKEYGEAVVNEVWRVLEEAYKEEQKKK